MIDNKYLGALRETPQAKAARETANRLYTGVVFMWIGAAIVMVSRFGWLGFGVLVGISGALTALRAISQKRAAEKMNLSEKDGAS